MKHLITAVVVCVLSTSAGYFMGSTLASQDASPVLQLPETRAHASYVNNREQFSFSVSPLWSQFFFVESYTERGFVVDVYMPVNDTTKLASFTEVEQRHGGVLVDTVLLMTEAQYDYEKQECEAQTDGPCFYPTEYARARGMVLAVENPDLHAGWDYCTELDMFDELVCTERDSDWIDGKSVIGRTLFFSEQ
jgi:hypothetical protein